MNYKEIIREAIRCPQFGDEYYGEWGALRYKQRLLIKRLLDECDSADSYIRKLYLEKQELIDYLKEQINICDDIIKSHMKEISGVVNISDNNRHMIIIRRFTIEKQVYEKILSKIEKE